MYFNFFIWISNSVNFSWKVYIKINISFSALDFSWETFKVILENRILWSHLTGILNIIIIAFNTTSIGYAIFIHELRELLFHGNFIYSKRFCPEIYSGYYDGTIFKTFFFLFVKILCLGVIVPKVVICSYILKLVEWTENWNIRLKVSKSVHVDLTYKF